jgi:hypothetical protein
VVEVVWEPAVGWVLEEVLLLLLLEAASVVMQLPPTLQVTCRRIRNRHTLSGMNYKPAATRSLITALLPH